MTSIGRIYSLYRAYATQNVDADCQNYLGLGPVLEGSCKNFKGATKFVTGSDNPKSQLDCALLNPNQKGCEDYFKGTNIKPNTPVIQHLLPATDPDNKKDVCGKNCSTFDIFCFAGKIQAGCGGGGIGCIPNMPNFPPLGCWTIPAAVALVVIFFILRRRF